MFYVMEWKIRTGYVGDAFKKFLETGAPFPGVTMHGRYHAPGSVNGWIILETDDISAVYRHAAEWAEFLEMKTTPVLNDEQAAEAAANLNSCLLYTSPSPRD